jgi:hypothetical protein
MTSRSVVFWMQLHGFKEGWFVVRGKHEKAV